MSSDVLDVVFYKNDFSGRVELLGTKFKLESMSWQTQGGPETATISGIGDWDIDEAINLLRAPVEVIGPNGDVVWWGYVNDVTAVDGPLSYGVSMDSVINNAKALFTQTGPSSSLQISTYWVNTSVYYAGTTIGCDPWDSISRFGVKENIISKNSSSGPLADRTLKTTIETYKYPMPTITHSPQNKERKIELKCNGWWSTLNWQYYPGVIQKNFNLTHHSLYSQNVGTSVDDIRAIAEKITVQYTGTITAAWINLGWAGAPGKAMRYSINANGATPGAILASVDVELARIQAYGGYAPELFTLSTPVSVTAGDQVWVVYDAQETSEGWYKVWCYQNGGGNALTQNAAGTWGSPGTPFDIDWQIVYTTDNGVRLSDALSTKAQFISGSSVPTISITTEDYNGGTQETALSAITNVLDNGSSNGRRLVAKVDRQRFVTVTEEVALTDANVKLILGRDGQLYNKSGGEVFPAYQDPTGLWCTVEGLVPSSISANRGVDVSCFIIERARFHGTDKKVTVSVEARGTRNGFSIFEIRNQ